MDTPTNNILDTLIKYLVVALAVFVGGALFFVNASASILSFLFFIVYCLIIAALVVFSYKKTTFFGVYVSLMALLTTPCFANIFNFEDYLFDSYAGMCVDWGGLWVIVVAKNLTVVFVVLWLFSLIMKHYYVPKTSELNVQNNQNEAVDISSPVTVQEKRFTLINISYYVTLILGFYLFTSLFFRGIGFTGRGVDSFVLAVFLVLFTVYVVIVLVSTFNSYTMLKDKKETAVSLLKKTIKIVKFVYFSSFVVFVFGGILVLLISRSFIVFAGFLISFFIYYIPLVVLFVSFYFYVKAVSGENNIILELIVKYGLNVRDFIFNKTKNSG